MFKLVSLHVNSLGVAEVLTLNPRMRCTALLFCKMAIQHNCCSSGPKSPSSGSCSEKMNENHSKSEVQNYTMDYPLTGTTRSGSYHVPYMAAWVHEYFRLHLCACLFVGPHLLPLASNESCSDLQLMVWLGWALTWPIQLFTKSIQNPPCES